jgi:RNA polymerase sigma-70 factor (ECF subfamily)
MHSLNDCSPVGTAAPRPVAEDAIGVEHARTALLSLRPKHQAVLALHYLEGLSLEEVAAVIGCRVGTVKSRLSRARVALRDRLTHGR